MEKRKQQRTIPEKKKTDIKHINFKTSENKCTSKYA